MTGEALWVGLMGLLTALATGLGALPVMAMGRRAEVLRPGLWGVAAGLMSVAAVVGLLAPALDEGSPEAVGAGLAAGVLFLLLVRAATAGHDAAGFAGRGVAGHVALVVFVVLLVHSIPEGLALGTAAASERAGLDVFVFASIALQNVPEGTSTALSMAAAGVPRSRQLWAAVATSLPQPPAAVAAYVLVDEVRDLLPVSFAFAAGAMLAVVAAELAPRLLARGTRLLGAAGVAAGAAVMGFLALALGV